MITITVGILAMIMKLLAKILCYSPRITLG